MGFGRAIGFCVAFFCGIGLVIAHAASPLLDAAAVALNGGNASNAIALANQALQDPSLAPRDRSRVLIDRGLAHELLGERDGALADFTDAINAHVLPPVEQSRAFYDRGVTLDELGRTEDAVKDYAAAISLAPRFAAALNNRGNAYRRLGRLGEARTDYLASVAAGNPRAEYPNFGLGQIAEMQSQPDAARTYYKAALAANAQFSLAAERLAALGPGSGQGAPVILKPPRGVVTMAGDVVLRPPPGVAPGADQPITLRPPGQAPVHLRPPGRRAPRPPVAASEPPSPDLKPAISEGAGGSGGAAVQLGAWRNEFEAADAWNRIASTSGNLLAGLSPRVVPVDLPGKGRYYRLRAGPVEPGGGPGLCAALQARGVECMVARD